MSELPFPRSPLADAIVALRPWVPADVPGNVMRFADPSVLRFSWPQARPYTEADARAFFTYQDQARRQGTELNFALTRPDGEEEVVGGSSLHSIDPTNRRACIGYWLVPDARGRGMATHATQLMARWAFAHLGVERLELTCGPDNAASQAVAQRSGFSREGVLRAHVPFKEGRRDTVVFSLLPADLR
jgi:RimJ/RimL family protein N-acetyltransferase